MGPQTSSAVQRNPSVIASPGSAEKTIRGNQFHHVIDVVPTILEVTGILSVLGVAEYGMPVIGSPGADVARARRR
jgi:arylsulfatase A-like enzyme